MISGLKKIRFSAFLILLSIVLAGCSTGVVPMGRDTYMIAGSSPGLVQSATIRARLLREADSWCRKQGLVMVPLNYSGREAVIGSHCANSEVIFRAVPPTDAENQRVRYERGVDRHEVLEIRNR
jgi:hypothetical protein